MKVAELKINDPICYDRFDGLKAPLEGYIQGFAYDSSREKYYVWVICKDEGELVPFLTPARKLSLSKNYTNVL